MANTLRLNFTGMVAFTPGYSASTVPELTFVMVDCPTRRHSRNYPQEQILKHVAFVMCHEDHIVKKVGRQIEIGPNQQDYAGWLLDKERLTLKEDPKTRKIEFLDLKEIVAMPDVCPDSVMDPDFASPRPQFIAPVAAQFHLQSGRVGARGPKAVHVDFIPPCGGGTPKRRPMRTIVTVAIQMETQTFSFDSLPLDEGPELPMMVFDFGGAKHMDIYIGSAPLASIHDLPNETIGQHKRDVDFELYYDLRRGGPGEHLPIPHAVSGKPPIAGSDRCPPLQNGG